MRAFRSVFAEKRLEREEAAGATNAGVLAAQILALGDPALRAALHDYKAEMARKVETADERLQAEL